MDVLIVLLALSIAVELGLQLPGLWALRRPLAVAGMLALAAGGTLLLAWRLNVFSVLIVALAGYRMFNMARVVGGRMHEHYLRRATLRTSMVVIILQGVVALAWLAWEQWHTTGHVTWTAIASLQFVAAAVSLASVMRTTKRTSWPAAQKHYSDDELPTLTVAIPARNETDELQSCLQSLVASDYPKLEILVLDDCSQTKRTPEIIRSFAHAGVRFIQGEQPPPTWLAKNYAYDQLLRHTSGELVLFCGADIRFERDSLRKLASLMIQRRKSMVSILPLRSPGNYGAASLIQAMRYWWELVPPRRFTNRPPVLSSCWIISRDALQKAGGFKAVARSIVPEAHFAKAAIRMRDGYSFLRAGRGNGIVSVKTLTGQRDTAVRMRYPQVHRRPEQVAIHSFLEFSFLLLPFALSLGGFFVDIGLAAQVIATLACLLLITTHELVVLSTKVNTWWFGLIAPPFMILADIVLLHYSMWKYEFSVVEWKGRNICIPAMHVIPHLPKI
ncbi:MAG: glycosyltransferase family 2 protein [Candidatus Saccharimonadales bacterium]